MGVELGGKMAHYIFIGTSRHFISAYTHIYGYMLTKLSLGDYICNLSLLHLSIGKCLHAGF